MKKGLVITLIVLGVIILAGICFLGSLYFIKSGAQEEKCAEANETCGGGIQGPNGEHSYTNCCAGLTCKDPKGGEFLLEMGICVKED